MLIIVGYKSLLIFPADICQAQRYVSITTQEGKRAVFLLLIFLLLTFPKPNVMWGGKGRQLFLIHNFSFSSRGYFPSLMWCLHYAGGRGVRIAGVPMPKDEKSLGHLIIPHFEIIQQTNMWGGRGGGYSHYIMSLVSLHILVLTWGSSSQQPTPYINLITGIELLLFLDSMFWSVLNNY